MSSLEKSASLLDWHVQTIPPSAETMALYASDGTVLYCGPREELVAFVAGAHTMAAIQAAQLATFRVDDVAVRGGRDVGWYVRGHMHLGPSATATEAALLAYEEGIKDRKGGVDE